MGAYRIFGYMPTRRQHTLVAWPEEVQEKLDAVAGGRGIKSRPGDDTDHEWEFFATEDRFTGQIIPCAIWHYERMGNTCSAFGPREVFEDLGLVVL